MYTHVNTAACVADSILYMYYQNAVACSSMSQHVCESGIIHVVVDNNEP